MELAPVEQLISLESSDSQALRTLARLLVRSYLADRPADAAPSAKEPGGLPAISALVSE